MRPLAEWPVDCLLLITDHLPSERDLNAIAQTNWRLYNIFNPYLYRHNIQRHGKTATLWWAVRYGEVNTARLSLRAGADPNAKDSDYLGGAALHKAIWARYELREAYHNITNFGGHCGVESSERYRLSIERYPLLIRVLLDNGADIHSRNRQGWTPLHKASWLPDEELVRLLVEEGADIAAVDDHGSTPLHTAAFTGDHGVVSFLLEMGANVHARRTDNRTTPLHEAAEQARPAAISLLLENGADLEARDKFGQTPLHCAASSGTLEPLGAVIQLLIDKGACIEAKDDRGMTPLQKVASQGHFEEVIILLTKNRANVNVRDRDGRTV